MQQSHQKRFFKLIRLEKALDLMKQSIRNYPILNEEIETIKSLGKVLDEDVFAKCDIPDHDYAAMDGYAVITNNILKASENNPVKLVIKGELYPSDNPTTASIKDHEAIYLACGAPIPRGADAVLKVEQAYKEGKNIIVRNSLEVSRNICLTGEDVKNQELVLSKGHTIRPQDIGLLIAMNKKHVKVVKNIRVSVISVGDELTEPFTKTANKTVNNNAYIVENLIRYLNSEPILMGIAKDSIEDIKQKMETAISNSDIVVTIAGCSVGVKDYVPNVVETLSQSGLIFHGVAVSAGKVSGFGIVKGKPVVMLPGHVGSAVGAFYLLVIPLLNFLKGLGFKDNLPVLKCKIDESIKAKPSIDFLLPVKVYRKNGEYYAKPLFKPISVLKNIADANGYVLLKADNALGKDDEVDVKIYSGLEFDLIED